LRVTSLLVAVVVATLSGCNGKCSGTFNCPAISSTVETWLAVPSSLGAPLASVTTTGPCTTNFTTGDNEGPVLVTGSAAGTCLVRGTLANGSEVRATLVYGQVDLGCCGSTLALTSSPPSFAPVDAGTS
jgi:hypothetical protein